MFTKAQAKLLPLLTAFCSREMKFNHLKRAKLFLSIFRRAGYVGDKIFLSQTF